MVYRVTPTQAGALAVNTFGGGYDTVVCVFTGTRGTPTELACNQTGDLAIGRWW